MAFIFPVEDKFPAWGDGCFIAPNATIVGDVIMGNQCSVWFNAVVRGDVVDRHQPVVGALGEPQHDEVAPVLASEYIPDFLGRRPIQSDSHTAIRPCQPSLSRNPVR